MSSEYIGLRSWDLKLLKLFSTPLIQPQLATIDVCQHWDEGPATGDWCPPLIQPQSGYRRRLWTLRWRTTNWYPPLIQHNGRWMLSAPKRFKLWTSNFIGMRQCGHETLIFFKRGCGLDHCNCIHFYCFDTDCLLVLTTSLLVLEGVHALS